MISNFLTIVGSLLISLNSFRLLGLAISDWCFFGAVVIMLLETITIDKQHISVWLKSPFYIPAWFILFGAIISTVNATSAAVALSEIFQQIYVMTLYVSIFQIIILRGKSDWVIKAFILSGVFSAGIALFDYSTGSRLGPILSGRPDRQLWYRYAGTLLHPNKFGYYLVLTSILTFPLLSNRSNPIRRLVWLALLAIQVFGIFLSGSVTAYIGLIFGTSLWVVSFLHFQRKAIKTLVVLTLLILPIIMMSGLIGTYVFEFNLNSRENIIARSLTRVQSNTAQSRLDVYLNSLKLIMESPFVGTSFDQLATSDLSGNRRLSYSVHNSLLQIWYVGGIFAFIGYIIIYFKLGITALKTLFGRNKTKIPPFMSSVAAATLSIMIMDQFQDGIYQREKWLVIGILAGYAYWEKHQGNTAPSPASAKNREEII